MLVEKENIMCNTRHSHYAPNSGASESGRFDHYCYRRTAHHNTFQGRHNGNSPAGGRTPKIAGVRIRTYRVSRMAPSVAGTRAKWKRWLVEARAICS